MATAEIKPRILNETDYSIGTAAYLDWRVEPTDEDYFELENCDTRQDPNQTLEEAIKDFAQYYPTNVVKAWVKREVAWGRLHLSQAFAVMETSHFVQYSISDYESLRGHASREEVRKHMRLMGGYEVLAGAVKAKLLPRYAEVHWEVKTDKLP